MIKTNNLGVSIYALSIFILLLSSAACVSDKPLTTEEKKPPLQIIKLTGVVGDYSNLKQIMDSKGTIHTVFLGRHGDGACMLDIQAPYKRPENIAVLRLDECNASTVSDIALAANAPGDFSVAWIQESQQERSLMLQKYSHLSGWMSPATVPLQGVADNLAMSLDAKGNLLAVWYVRAGGGFYAAYCDVGGSCQGVSGLRMPDTAEVIHVEVVTAGNGDFMLLWEQNDDKGNFTIFSGYFSQDHGFNTAPVVVAKGRGNLSGTWMAQTSTPERIVVSWTARNIYAREYVLGTGWYKTQKVKEMYSSPNYTNLGSTGDEVIITWKDGGDRALRSITSKKAGLWSHEEYFGDGHEASSLMWPKMISEQPDSLSLFWVEEGREIWGNNYVNRSGWTGARRINKEEYYSVNSYKALGNGQKSALIIFPTLDEQNEREIVEFDSINKSIGKYRTTHDYGISEFVIQYME